MNLDCDMIKDLLALYHDGVASPSSKKAVANHLQNCKECRSYYKQYCNMYRKIGTSAKTMKVGEGSYPCPDYSHLARRMRYIRRLLGVGAVAYTGISISILMMLFMRLQKR